MPREPVVAPLSLRGELGEGALASEVVGSAVSFTGGIGATLKVRKVSRTTGSRDTCWGSVRFYLFYSGFSVSYLVTIVLFMATCSR